MVIAWLLFEFCGVNQYAQKIMSYYRALNIFRCGIENKKGIKRNVKLKGAHTRP